MTERLEADTRRLGAEYGRNVRQQAAMTPAQFQADLADSLASLLDTVWRCEREWSFDDRLALAVAVNKGRTDNDT